MRQIPLGNPNELSVGHVRPRKRLRAGETLRGIDPPDPYRVLIKIPGGMEYTNGPGEADVASAKTIRSKGAIPFDITDGHTSLAYVRHGNQVETAEYHPTVISPSG